ncbi:MAG: DUF3592 domain-containing protein [Clostridia bacterium]|nr:DUF3592 domain-containing protein [Clostridia bacterium]
MVIRNKFVIYALLSVMVVALAVIGIVVVVNNQNKTKGYVRVKAVVVDYRERFDYDDYEMMYSEIVEYEVDGFTYLGYNDVWTNVPKGIGKEIEIAYDPANPARCVFVKSQNFMAIICFSISGISLLALILQVIMDMRAKRKSNDGYYEHNLIA